ncbi:MAG: biotin transporter BioY [Holosporales bacterium]|jgi:biotin transport system substrate-specific component|nr:biotin transporter BioY [Holosporales bacterium]
MINTGSNTGNCLTSSILQCLRGACIIAIGSHICVPFVPVPLTLQTLSVLFVVSHLGSKLGACSALLYLLEGLAGIPVFAEFSAGPAVVFGPSGGYLMGFIPAAYLTGILLEQRANRTFLSVFLAGLAGEIILLFIGFLQLSYFMGFADAYTFGIIPFILGDFLKLTIFAMISSVSSKK